MPRKEKFKEYEYETKTTTIRIPDLKDLDKEKQLRKEIDNFVLEKIFKKQSLKANTFDNELNDKLLLLMIKAGIDSDDYGINITMEEIGPNIERLKKRGSI